MFEDSNLYNGEWKDGLMHGEGTLKYRDGSVYKGEFKSGLLHGKGKFISKNWIKNYYEKQFNQLKSMF